MTVECVVNVSEGRDQGFSPAWLTWPARSFSTSIRDPDHHRSVFTLAGEAESVTRGAGAGPGERRPSRSRHAPRGPSATGRPRCGALHPLYPGRLPSHDLDVVIPLRDAFARWMGATWACRPFSTAACRRGKPYIAQVRRHAFAELPPDFGPRHPHPPPVRPRSGPDRCWWPTTYGFPRSRWPARCTPGPGSRRAALGLAVGRRAQVSCNLVEPAQAGPAQAYDTVRALVEEAGGAVEGAELIGLLPAAVLQAIPASRWTELGLGAEKTVEARLGRPADQTNRLVTNSQFRRRAHPIATLERRARRTRRRSRSLMPPQMPNFSPLASAYSRQSSRTTQPRQTSWLHGSMHRRSGKNRSGSTPMQFA